MGTYRPVCDTRTLRTAFEQTLKMQNKTRVNQQTPSAATMNASDAAKPCEGTIRIAFVSPEMADMVKQCMDVDDELQPARLLKTTHVEGSALVM
jgi:hypothetical protein